uniref:GPI alpha-1,4-mannosyltransferase I, catalytic subunit n=1 Tax=Meloidogyne incognita TaxID=6306 RepID=A0A914LIB8_MELIC
MTRPLIWSDNNLFILAFLVRLFFILYARIHDYLFNLNFTDVDYEVFTEAALLVLQGSSPYNLSTYRYSPIIAWILVPNYLFEDFGKIIFSILDVLVGWIQLQYFTQSNKISTTKKEIISNKLILFRRSICLLWLFNLFNIIIATRGNSDALICFLNLLTMLELSKGNYLLSAFIHGLATHLRIFPLIYLPSIFLHLSNYKNKNSGKNIKLFILNCLQNKRGFLFIFISIFSFLLSTFICYLFYGQSFIYSSFLYHLTRVDVSHNFSPYFLPLYLSMNNKEWTKFIGIFSFFPQIICNAFFALKVSTSQYFIWYFCFLPLIIHKIKLNLNKLFLLLAIWLFAQGNWLLPAYLLEFCGYNTFVWVWFGSLIFLITNCYIMIQFINYYLFEEKKLVEKKIE